MTLEGLYASIWQLLEAGARDPAHPFHLGALASIDGDSADARTVVVRAAEREAARILVYTDRRSPKLEQLRAHPRVALVLYGLKQQLRLRAHVSVHGDDALAARCWEACAPSSRRAYLSTAAPGSRIDAPGSGLPAGLDQRQPTAAESAAGRVNFVVLALQLDAIDWLHLASDGHRRARFRLEPPVVDGEWVVP